MIQIRQKSFETNSSSTHCLVIPKADIAEDLRKDITVFENVDQPTTFISESDKLRYFWTICVQEHFINGAYDFSEMMKQTFPSCNFILPKEDEKRAYFEDAEWFFYGDKQPCLEFLNNPEFFKEFIHKGIIYYDDRDSENYDHSYYHYESLINNKCKTSWGVCWAG